MKNKSIAVEFLRSALYLENSMMKTEDVPAWLETRKKAVHHQIAPIRFSEMSQWAFEHGTSNLRHQSGRFFSIEGVCIKTNLTGDQEQLYPGTQRQKPTIF